MREVTKEPWITGENIINKFLFDDWVFWEITTKLVFSSPSYLVCVCVCVDIKRLKMVFIAAKFLLKRNKQVYMYV